MLITRTVITTVVVVDVVRTLQLVLKMFTILSGLKNKKIGLVPLVTTRKVVNLVPFVVITLK